MVQKLTIDNLTVWKGVRSISPPERVQMAKDPRGSYWLSLLTPAQYAELFPNYYKKQLPDIGKSTSSGGTSYSGGASSSGSYSSYGGGGGSFSPGDAANNKTYNKDSSGSTVSEKQDTRPAWQKELDKEYAATNADKILDFKGKVSVDSKGNMNKNEFFAAAVKTFEKSSLNGFVPADGEKYGIDGTPKSWARFAMSVANPESGFNVATTNMNDPGGSLGVFQWGMHYGINSKNWKDPQAQLDAFATYSDQWVVNGGGYIKPPSGVKAKRYAGHGGFGAAFSTVRNDTVLRKEHQAIANKLAAAYDEEVIKAERQEMGSSKETGDPNQTNQVMPEPSLRPSQDPGLNPKLKEYMDSIPDTTEGQEQKRQLQQKIDKLGTSKVNEIYERHQNEVAEQNNRQPVDPGEVPKELTSDLTYLSNERNANVKGVNKKLLAIQNEAARRYMAENPGSRVIVNGTVENGKAVGGPGSGVRTGSNTGNHGPGHALDVTIIDKDGKALENYQSGEYAAEYQKLQNFGKLAQEKYFPELNNHYAGGMYFSGGGRNRYGELDLMHSDIRGNRGRLGNWETGFNETAIKRYNIDPEKNMGMKDFRKIYSYDNIKKERGEMGSSKEEPKPSYAPTALPMQDRGITAGHPLSKHPLSVSPAMPEPSLRPVSPPAANPAPQTPQTPAAPTSENKAAPVTPPQPQASAQKTNPNLAMDMSTPRKGPASQERAMKRATLGGQEHFNPSPAHDHA